jgi:hypothetical protein
MLLIAKLVLVDRRKELIQSSTMFWWTYRCAFVHQKILENYSQTLQDIIFESLEALILPSLELNREIHTKYHLEKGLVYHYYKMDTKSVIEFTKAQECSRFLWNVTGALGKRTKFQTFDVSQLVVMASSHEDGQEDKETYIEKENIIASNENVNNGYEVNHKVDNLKGFDLALNNDTLLDKIAFTSDETNRGQKNLKVIDQCILLAFCMNVKNVNPADGLTNEEMMPYVCRVLEHPNNWMVHTMALLLRSRLEVSKSRKVERACLQLQTLVDQFKTTDSTVSERLAYFFSIEMPAKWQLEVLRCLSNNISKNLVVYLFL